MRTLAQFLDLKSSSDVIMREDSLKLTPRKSEESKAPRASLVDDVHVKPKSGSRHGYVEMMLEQDGHWEQVYASLNYNVLYLFYDDAVRET
jgi:hypothetical protein